MNPTLPLHPFRPACLPLAPPLRPFRFTNPSPCFTPPSSFGPAISSWFVGPQGIACEAYLHKGVDTLCAAEAALASGNLAAGAFQVENAIISACESGGPVAFRRGGGGARGGSEFTSPSCLSPGQQGDGDSDSRPSKRQRATAPPPRDVGPPYWGDGVCCQPLESWRALAKLYSLLDFKELERLVQSQRLAAVPGLQAALEAMSRGGDAAAAAIRHIEAKPLAADAP